jgi:hypothetical protein
MTNTTDRIAEILLDRQDWAVTLVGSVEDNFIRIAVVEYDDEQDDDTFENSGIGPMITHYDLELGDNDELLLEEGVIEALNEAIRLTDEGHE